MSAIYQQTTQIQQNTFLITTFLLKVSAIIASSSGRIYVQFVGVLKT